MSRCLCCDATLTSFMCSSHFQTISCLFGCSTVSRPLFWYLSVVLLELCSSWFLVSHGSSAHLKGRQPGLTGFITKWACRSEKHKQQKIWGLKVNEVAQETVDELFICNHQLFLIQKCFCLLLAQEKAAPPPTPPNQITLPTTELTWHFGTDLKWFQWHLSMWDFLPVFVQDDRTTCRNNQLPSGQEAGGQKPPEAAEGSTEDETIKRRRLRWEPLPPTCKECQTGLKTCSTSHPQKHLGCLGKTWFNKKHLWCNCTRITRRFSKEFISNQKAICFI